MFDCAQKAQYMDGHREKFKRLDESSPRSSVPSEMGGRSSLRFSMPRFGYGPLNAIRTFMSGVRKGSGRLKPLRQSLTAGAPKTAFAEDLKSFKKNIFDPQEKLLLRMNRFFFLSCIIAVAVDPLFFFIPIIKNSNCIGIDEKLAVGSTIVRTIIDFVYLIRIFLQFRTAYVAPSSRVFGTGCACVPGDEEEDGVDDLESEFNWRDRNDSQYVAESMLHAHMSYGRGGADLNGVPQPFQPIPNVSFLTNGQMVDDIPPEQHALVPSFMGGGGKRIHPLPYADPNLPVQPRSMDLSKDLAAYGYGSVAWKERMESWKQKQERLHQMRNDGSGKDWDGDGDGDDADLPLYDPGNLFDVY